MATYYKYKSREGKDIVDWRAITKGITDDITRIEGEREQQRVDIDNAVLTNLEDIANKPQGAYSKENDRISSYAEQASAIALANQKLLKSGAISLKEYNSRTNTGLSSTKKLFTLSKQYQDNYEAGMKRLQSIDGKPPVGSEIEAMLMGSVERFGPPGSTDYYIDPITGEAFLASTIEDGDPNTYENTKKIDGVNKSLMSVGTAEGIINRQVDRYQSDVEATRLAESLGTKIEVLQGSDPNIKTKEDAFARMFETKDGKTVLSEFGEAVNKSIEASMVTDMSKASMLIDTMGADGYYMYTKNDNGTFTDLRTNTRMDSIPDKNLGIEMFVDNSGAYQPRLTVDQEKAAIDGVRDMIRTKLDVKETARPDTRMTEYQSGMLGLKRDEIKKSQQDKVDSLEIKVRSIADLYSGNNIDIKSATEYFRDINPSVTLVDRTNDGFMITYTDENGAVQTRPIVFKIDNPNFDESKSEGPDNPRKINKNQREFLISSANLLIGKEADSVEFKNLINAKNKDDQFIFNETLSTGEATSESGITEPASDSTFNLAFDTYLDGKLNNEIFKKLEGALAEDLEDVFTDMGLKASTVGTATSKVLITVPGYTGDPLTIDANNRTEGGRVTEKEKLKKYLRQVFKQRPDLSDTLKITDKEGNLVPFTPDPVRKNKGFG